MEHQELDLRVLNNLYVDSIEPDANADISINNNKIVDMETCTDPFDAANKFYVDSLLPPPGNNSKYFDAYDNIGDLILTPANVFLDINLTSQRSIDIDTYNHVLNDSEVEVLADATYIILGRVSTYITSGSTRSQSAMRLLLNNVEIEGSLSYMYNREVLEGYNTGCAWAILPLTVGDKIKMQAKLQTGTTTSLKTVKDASSLILFKIEGIKGDTGDTGPAGADGDLTWEGQFVFGTAYTPNQVVHYNGSAYVAITNNSNENPDTSPNWELLAAQGALGSGSNITLSRDNTNVGLISTLNIEESTSSLEVSNSGSLKSTTRQYLIPEIVKLRTTTNININSASGIDIDWDITDIIDNSTYNLNSPTEIEILKDGIYELSINLAITSTTQRFNNTVRFQKNGVDVNGSGRSAYIRSQSGHNNSSNYFSTIEALNTGDLISVESTREGANGNAFLINGESLFIIKKLDLQIYD